MDDYLTQLQQGALPQQEPEQLTEREQMEEMVFMALRMNQGLQWEAFAGGLASGQRIYLPPLCSAVRRRTGWQKGQTESC